MWSIREDTIYADSVKYTLPGRVAGTCVAWDILKLHSDLAGYGRMNNEAYAVPHN